MKAGIKKKKHTIFQFILVPLLFVMLLQNTITIGILVANRVTSSLREYSVNTVAHTVENRQMILQNDMTQRWSSISSSESDITVKLEQFLNGQHLSLEQFLHEKEQQSDFLGEVFTDCLEIIKNNISTGIFLIMTDGSSQEKGEYTGFFVRDSDPVVRSPNYSDLLLERGNNQLSRSQNIPLDSFWTTNFNMQGIGTRQADDFFYEPWRAGEEHPDAETINLGFWATPFTLENNENDDHKMITYSVPLRFQGQVYGVLGVEISMNYLLSYLPARELSERWQAGYLLAVCTDENTYRPIAGDGVLFNSIESAGECFTTKSTDYDKLLAVRDVRLGKNRIMAIDYPLRLYSNNAPYKETQWVLFGLNTEAEIFGISRQLYLWLGIAVLVSLTFGMISLYFIVRHLTRPIDLLVDSINQGREGLAKHKYSRIFEIDRLYDELKDLTQKQQEAENRLLVDKERYRLLVESTEDIFFSYDYIGNSVDIVNTSVPDGYFSCSDKYPGFINPEIVYYDDIPSLQMLYSDFTNTISIPFRMKLPAWGNEYQWVLVTGSKVADLSGNPWKLVGRIHNIEEEKQEEEYQQKKNQTDSVTRLLTYLAGMEELEKSRGNSPSGVMVCFLVENLLEISEENGVVYSLMFLDIIGNIILQSCKKYESDAGTKTVALRFNENTLFFWLPNCTKEEAERFFVPFMEKLADAANPEIFKAKISTGAVCCDLDIPYMDLLRMAKCMQEEAQRQQNAAYLLCDTCDKLAHVKLPFLQGRNIYQPDYDDETNIAALALNLFGKGNHLASQIQLLLGKIGMSFQAKDILITVMQAEYFSNYLEYQWHEKPSDRIDDTVNHYVEKEWHEYDAWVGEQEVIALSEADGSDPLLQKFLHVREAHSGVALPMYDNGNYTGAVVVLGIDEEFFDNTEERQRLTEIVSVIQNQLNQSRHDLASKAKSDFLSRMSHEIRTPMNGIIGMTAIALQKDQNNERILDCLHKIQDSSSYLLGLINDILDMSKIESGKMQLEVADFDMTEIFTTIYEMIRPQAEVKNIRLNFETDLHHQWFRADKMRISQVLINLLGNAVKFTEMQGDVYLIVKEYEKDDASSEVYFAVKDTGVGISKEDCERVFHAFEQAIDSKKPKQQGTGLGLSISSRLIQMMGSSIQLESELGEGSTFSFRLTLALGEREEEQETIEENAFSGYRVLVVEDNELNAEIAQELLEERGFTVELACDGSQAVKTITEKPPHTYDVILMDVMMPIMDGLEATKAIRAMEREDCRTIPIIAMSANAFDDDLKKSVECGMNGHLSKPVEVDKLYRMLHKVLLGR